MAAGRDVVAAARRREATGAKRLQPRVFGRKNKSKGRMLQLGGKGKLCAKRAACRIFPGSPRTFARFIGEHTCGRRVPCSRTV